MTTIAAIRTHHWGEDAQRLHAQLAPVFGAGLVAAFHNRPKDLALPLPVVDIDDHWLAANRLQRVPDWGWRCGDYFLYAVRKAYPQADYLWLIEPDVHFTGPVADFFARMATRSEDLLGVKVEPLRPDNRFARGLPEVPAWRSIFALTRFSGRAVDRLFALRQAYAGRKIGPRFYSNDEVFCVSTLVAAPDFSHASMSEIAPDWFRPGAVATDPDVLIDTLEGDAAPGVFHPVRGRVSFRGAVAGRIAGNLAFLNQMRPSLARLTDEDIDDIAAEVGRRCAQALRRARKT